MNLLTLLKAEFNKHKLGVVWLISIGIPVGTSGIMLLDMVLRYNNYLRDLSQKNGISSWEMLLNENHRVLGWGMFIPLFIALIATIIHYVELEGDNWKKLLVFPVFRGEVYLAKFITIGFFSFVMITLNTVGLIIVGKIIGFSEPINYNLYGGYILRQCGAILGVSALHNLFSITSKNAIKPVIIGFMGMLITPAIISKSELIGKFIPYAYTYNVDGLKNIDPLFGAFVGIIAMIIISIVGIFYFSKRDMV